MNSMDKFMEQQDTQSNVVLRNNSESTFDKQIEKIENTPFHMVMGENGGYFAVMGKYQITHEMIEESEVLKLVKEPNWEMIINLILMLKNI